jgi:hypothetical protein
VISGRFDAGRAPAREPAAGYGYGRAAYIWKIAPPDDPTKDAVAELVATLMISNADGERAIDQFRRIVVLGP